MITTTTLTAAIRRQSVRDYADIDIDAISDAILDQKIERADITALAKFGYSSAPSDEPTVHRIIIAADLSCARRICIGIGDDENTARANDLMIECDKIVEAHNNKAPEQNRNIISYTTGNGGFS